MVDLCLKSTNFVGPKWTRFSPCIRITFRANLLYKSFCERKSSGKHHFIYRIYCRRRYNCFQKLTNFRQKLKKQCIYSIFTEKYLNIKSVDRQSSTHRHSQTKRMTDLSPRHTKPPPKNKQSLYDRLKHFPNDRSLTARS